MSNYLHQIAAKSLNLIPVVRPRLTSMFEPPTDRLNFLNELPERELETNEVIMPPTTSATPKPVSQRTDSSMMNDEVTPTRSSEESPTTLSKSVVPSPQDGIDMRSQKTSNISPSLAGEDLPLGNVSIQSPSSEASCPNNSLIAPVTHSAPEKSSIPINTNVDASTSSPLIAPVRNSAPEEPSIPIKTNNNVDASGSNSSMTPLPSKPSNLVPVQSQIIPSISPSLPSSSASVSISPVTSSSQQNSSSSPTIQVNIGRIEVRAIAPKQSSPKIPKARPAKPSLEKYLRSRSSPSTSRNRGSS